MSVPVQKLSPVVSGVQAGKNKTAFYCKTFRSVCE